MTKIRNLLVALGVVAGLGVAAIPLSSYAVEEGEGGTTTPGQSVDAYGEIAVEIGGSISIYIADNQGNYIDHIDLGEIMNNSAQVRGYNMEMIPVVTTNSTTGYNLAMSFGYTGFGGGASGEECDEACVEKIQQRQQNLTNNNSLRTTFTFDDNDAAIPAVGENGRIQPGVSAWGYKLTEIRETKYENGPSAYSYTDKTDSSCTEYTCWSAMPASNQAITIDSRNPSDVRDYQLGVRFGVSANGTQAEGRYTGSVIFIATAR